MSEKTLAEMISEFKVAQDEQHTVAENLRLSRKENRDPDAIARIEAQLHEKQAKVDSIAKAIRLYQPPVRA